MNKNNIIDYITYIPGRELTTEENFTLNDVLDKFASCYLKLKGVE